MLGRWRQLWGRAGVDKVVVFERQEGTEGEFGASGFFSLTASHSKANQFICECDVLPSQQLPLIA